MHLRAHNDDLVWQLASLTVLLVSLPATAQTPPPDDSPPTDTVENIRIFYQRHFCGEALFFAQRDLLSHPNDPDSVYRAARTAYCTGDYLAARQYFERFLQITEEGWNNRRQLARNFLQSASQLIATVTIRTDVAERIEGAQLFIDGQRRSIGAPADVNPGRPVNVEVTAPGYLTYRETHQLPLGDRYERQVPLQPVNRRGVPTLVWVGLGAVVVGVTAGLVLLNLGGNEQPRYEAMCPVSIRSTGAVPFEGRGRPGGGRLNG